MIADLQGEEPGSESSEKIRQILQKSGCEFQIRSFKSRAHQASQAAELLGCSLDAVVKSLVFQNIEDGHIALVLVSGENRVDLNKLCQILGGKFQSAKPAEIESLTGYKVGAVPPFGFETHYPVTIDADLMAYAVVWASAGTAHTLMGIEPRDLENLTQGGVEKIHK